MIYETPFTITTQSPLGRVGALPARRAIMDGEPIGLGGNWGITRSSSGELVALNRNVPVPVTTLKDPQKQARKDLSTGMNNLAMFAGVLYGVTALAGAEAGAEFSASAGASSSSSASETVFDLGEFGEWGSDAIAADTVDWEAVASSWEGAVAESAAQNAALEAASASSLDWLSSLKEIGSRVGTNLLSRELFGGGAPRPGSSASATSPRTSAPQLPGSPNPFGVSFAPQGSTSSPASNALVLGGAIALAVIVAIKVFAK